MCFNGTQNCRPSLEKPFMTEDIVAELAPSGTLRAGINMGNFLLVTGKTPSGDPTGVSPDMAAEIASRLGVPLSLVPYATPGELIDVAGTGAWDICLVGAEPAREKLTAFTAAYAEIQATYIVANDSPLKSVDEVDRAGVRAIVRDRSAYGLYLRRTIKNAELILTDSFDEARDRFVDEKLDALAGLRSGLLSELEKMPGARLLDGSFTSVQQAVGTSRENKASIAFLRDFVEEKKANGFVAQSIERHNARGLTVAPPA
jgi:polar amino acid transport system substrate-binding protein